VDFSGKIWKNPHFSGESLLLVPRRAIMLHSAARNDKNRRGYEYETVSKPKHTRIGGNV